MRKEAVICLIIVIAIVIGNWITHNYTVESVDDISGKLEDTEIEKVENNLTSVRSFIETKNYSDAISELDKANFLLKHIEDKYPISLENIF